MQIFRTFSLPVSRIKIDQQHIVYMHSKDLLFHIKSQFEACYCLLAIMSFLKTSQALTLRRAGGHTMELKVHYSGTKRRDEMTIPVKSEDPMWILIDKVCQSWGSTREKARFFVDGVRILLYHTAESVSPVPHLL